MVKGGQQNLPEKGQAVTQIMVNRDAFMTYNIRRMRELIRYLSPKKARLFQLIPLWLHVNAPNIPGYIKDPQTPCGIYRFPKSGFYKQALTLLKMPDKKMRPLFPKRDVITGIYLMGSSGTLAQSYHSDFDYWIIVDENALTSPQLALLERKLSLLEAYCQKRYGHAVTFFILTPSQVQANEFAALDSESSGSSQKSLLKEEFYRTFIMIAGKVPFWAVLPPGLTDEAYQQWISSANRARHFKFIPDDYIDLGNVTPFNDQETLGALLWQIYKAKSAPAKSLIKASLILYYFFFYGKEGLLCDLIKARYLKNSDAGHLIDPYAVLFEKSGAFIESLQDSELMTLFRESVFLRLSGYKSIQYETEKTPKEALLNRLVHLWQWDKETRDRLLNYGTWPETEKLSFEKKVFDKLSFFYELAMRARGDEQPPAPMAQGDLRMLTNQIDACFKAAPGKIGRCSIDLKRHVAEYYFTILGQEGHLPEGRWTVYGKIGGPTMDSRAVLLDGPEILKIAGWLIANQLYRPKMSGVTFQHAPMCPISGPQAQRLVNKVHAFFKDAMACIQISEDAPVWSKLFILLHSKEVPDSNTFSRADFLVMNSWGNFYFDMLALSKFDTLEAACYSVAEHVWMLLQQVPSWELPFRIMTLKGTVSTVFLTMLDDVLFRFKANRSAIANAQRQSKKEVSEETLPLLLDG